MAGIGDCVIDQRDPATCILTPVCDFIILILLQFFFPSSSVAATTVAVVIVVCSCLLLFIVVCLLLFVVVVDFKFMCLSYFGDHGNLLVLC